MLDPISEEEVKIQITWTPEERIESAIQAPGRIDGI
jgi:hypothetical protein